MPPLILCHPLLLPSFPPNIRGFSCESPISIRWSKYWSFSFSINPSNEHSGFISFKIDWFDLLAVQVTLKSLLQQQSLKASILQHSAFFTGFPGSSDGKLLQCRRPGFNPCVGKIPWRRARQPTPLFLPGESPWTEAWQATVHGVTKSQTRLSD